MGYLGLAMGWYVIFIISMTFHEAAHAFTAMKFGDKTAYGAGQVSLDPICHIRREPFGTVVFPVLSFLFFGWMVGWASTPYDPYWAQRNRRKAALMALAGPAANFILLLASGLAIHIGASKGIFHAPEGIASFELIAISDSSGMINSVAVLLSICFSLNLILFIFNLIPLPPLDGSNIAFLALSDRGAERYREFMSKPGSRIFGLIVAWHIFGIILYSIRDFALDMLY